MCELAIEIATSDHASNKSGYAYIGHPSLLGVTYARYGAAMAVSLSQAEFYLQGFPLKGGGSFVLDGAEGMVSRNFGIVGGPGADMRIKYSSDFQHLIVRIKPQRRPEP